jgi:hypothetical protein
MLMFSHGAALAGERERGGVREWKEEGEPPVVRRPLPSSVMVTMATVVASTAAVCGVERERAGMK